MFDLKIYIDKDQPFPDGKYPLVVRVLYAGQTRFIHLPHHFSDVSKRKNDQKNINGLSKFVTDISDDELIQYLADVLEETKRMFETLEANGGNNFEEELIRLTANLKHD